MLLQKDPYDEGYWSRLSLYQGALEAELHGICPDGCKKLYPEYAKGYTIEEYLSAGRRISKAK